MSVDIMLDLYGAPAITTKANLESPGANNRHFENLVGKNAAIPEYMNVPVIGPLPTHSRPSSEPTISFCSTGEYIDTPSNNTKGSRKTDLQPIEWSNIDLKYLLSIFYPDLVIQGQLTFTPSLEALEGHKGPIYLTLHAHISDPIAPGEAYNCEVPIGTGRPPSVVLLAESAPLCYSPALARKSLAEALLRNVQGVNVLYAKYNVISSIYSLLGPQLESLLRGMHHMTKIDAMEKLGRTFQLKDVDEECGIEPRIEAYLLGSGFAELQGWIGCVEFGLELGLEERMVWSEVYRAAGEFLKRVI